MRNNHHHPLQAIECVDGRVLWANLHRLFWLSLVLVGLARLEARDAPQFRFGVRRVVAEL